MYQFYSYDTPGVKPGPIRGVISLNISNREGRMHFVGKLTQVSDSGPSWPSCLYDGPRVKTGPASGVTSWTIETMKPIFKILFLSHLSTTRTRGAFRITRCPSSVMCPALSTISFNINCS